MATELIPAMDVFPIPGPVWLFQVLLVSTFVLHLLFVNITLGGTMMAAIAHLSSGGRPGDYRTELAARLMRINTFGISLTITTAIAPLLFVQVLYQQYFYTATILISWIWLFLLVFLMIGYYSTYVYKFRGLSSHGSGGTGWLLVAALLFFVVAMVHVAVNLVHSQPEGWAALAGNPWMVLADPAYFPRLLHFVLASLGFSGMILGTRKSHYWVWVVGVGLMVIVVLKLFFVDLGNTGTVARIVSFLGVGALLMIVGYFAPRPPRPISKTADEN